MIRKELRLSLALLASAVVAGCGGGDSKVSQISGGFQVESGQAQKGPLLRGSLVTVNELSSTTLQPTGGSYSFEITDDYGTFKPAATQFTKPLLESTALGYYFDELTGVPSTGIVILRALSDLTVDRAVNINILTDLSKARIRALVTRPTSPLAFDVARRTAQREVLSAFNVYNSTDLMSGGSSEPSSFSELDLSRNRNADQVLAAISAVVTQIGKTSGGINQFINAFEADLADDGFINNSPAFAAPPSVQIKAAAKAVDWNALSVNLNKFYKTTRYTSAALKQWMDTSGGIDGVIDRYKTSAINLIPGTASPSGDYIIGSDDAGKCFSASTGTIYRNGIAVVGSVMVAKTDKMVISIVASPTGGTGDPTIGYIQRSLPINGVCPSTAPTVGLTRVAKHSVSANVLSVKISALDDTLVILGSDSSAWEFSYDTTGMPRLIGSGFVDVDAGCAHYVALKNDGSVWTWGYNGVGQLGDGNESSVRSQFAKQIGTGFVAVDAGCLHSVALKSDGSLWAWGSNRRGEFGDGSLVGSAVPKKIGIGYRSIAAGMFHTTALKADGSWWAWGAIEQVGTAGSFATDILSPRLLGAGYATVAAMGDGSDVATKADGSLWVSRFPALAPVPVDVGYSVISHGPGHALALKKDGSLWSWGDNSNGALGDGTVVTRNIPKQIGSGYKAVVSFDGKSAALHQNGSVWVWGRRSRLVSDGTLVNDLVPRKLDFPSMQDVLPVASINRGGVGFVGAVMSLDGSQSADPSGRPITYNWTLSAKPTGSAAALSNAQSVKPTFLMDKAGVYVVSLVVSNGILSSGLELENMVAVVPNINPVANAGVAQRVDIGALVSLNGSASVDANGDALTYSWVMVSKPAGSSAVLISPASGNPNFKADVVGAYVANLTVNDGRGGVASASVTITATTVNIAPVGNAGLTRTVAAGAMVTLDASASSDANGDLLTYSWVLTNKPVGSMAVLSSVNAVKPTFKADKLGDYTANLTVSDGRSNSSPISVKISAVNYVPVAKLLVTSDYMGGFAVDGESFSSLSGCFSLDAAGSFDANGDNLSYIWEASAFYGAPAVKYSGVAISSCFPPSGGYVRLVVSDGVSMSAPITVNLSALAR